MNPNPVFGCQPFIGENKSDHGDRNNDLKIPNFKEALAMLEKDRDQSSVCLHGCLRLILLLNKSQAEFFHLFILPPRLHPLHPFHLDLHWRLRNFPSIRVPAPIPLWVQRPEQVQTDWRTLTVKWSPR